MVKSISNFWKSTENQRAFLESIAVKLNVKQWKDWYTVSTLSVINLGGASILNYHGSLSNALTHCFPSYPWKIHEFDKVPNGWWHEEKNIKDTLKFLEEKLNIKYPDEWSSITSEQLKILGYGGFLKSRKGGLSNLLSLLYPSVDWKKRIKESQKLGKNSKSQETLIKSLCFLFPSNNVFSNYSDSDFKYPSSERQMIFDAYIPSLRLAIEYQGIQHFSHNDLYNSPEISLRDLEKRKKSEELGITLVYIPYWWDRTPESLKATIASYRPDIFPISGNIVPIPKYPPSRKDRNLIHSNSQIPLVDATTLYPEALLKTHLS